MQKLFPAIGIAIIFIVIGLFLWKPWMQQPSDWQFPIGIGDNRTAAQRVAGVGTTPEGAPTTVQWYPDAGFSIFYDDSWNVTQLNFPGTYTTWHLYEGQIYKSLTTRSTYQDFLSALGTPYEENPNDSLTSDFYAKWKIDGLGIEATFWKSLYEENGVKYESETLKYLTIKRSL